MSHLGKNVTAIDLNKKGSIISDNDKDGYKENVILDLDLEDSEGEGTNASTSKGGDDGAL